MILTNLKVEKKTKELMNAMQEVGKKMYEKLQKKLKGRTKSR
jgi:hypothetical protein